jgi:hypothetical protein
MASQTFTRLGPGTLHFGDTGDGMDFAARTTKTSIAPDIKDEDPVPLLNGDDYVAEGDVTGSVSGEFYQDLDMAGLVAWTWQHAGEVMTFEFIPSTAGKIKATGQCKIKPVTLGGDVKKANTSEFEFPLVGGLPTLAAYTPSQS